MVSVRDDGPVDAYGSDRNARAREPSSLTTLLAERIAALPADSRQRPLLDGILRAHSTNQDRRAAVLKHPDLAKRLGAALSLRHPSHWTGYIPPHLAVDDDGGILRSVVTGRDGSQRNRYHQLGARSCGMIYNDSPQRTALLEISAEAWEREHQ